MFGSFELTDVYKRKLLGLPFRSLPGEESHMKMTEVLARRTLEVKVFRGQSFS